MITTNNILLFRLEVFHDYFSSGLCSCLHFEPAENTRVLQKRFGFLHNHFRHGFEWYVNTKMAVSERLDYIAKVTGEDGFDFDINTRSDNFYGFTQLPAGWAGQCSFDSGNILSTQSGAELQPQLSPATVDGPIGKLRISFSDLLSGGLAKEMVYSIRFTARATQWQYFVVNSSQVPLNQPLVKGTNGDAFEFSGPEQVSMANGQHALLFTSGSRLIPLSEAPKSKFSLLSRPEHAGGNASAKAVFKNLPQPDPQYWEFVQVNGARQTASPMYVYL